MSSFEKRPLSSIPATVLEMYLHSRLAHSKLEVEESRIFSLALNKIVINWVPRQQLYIPLGDIKKFDIGQIDIMNAHGGKQYPVPMYIAHILTKIGAFGKLYYQNNSRDATHWQLTFHVGSRTSQGNVRYDQSKVQIRSHI